LFLKFRNNVPSAEKSARTGHPETRKRDENVDQVKEHILENRSMTHCDVANMV
jgi:hypothetical protein